ncbi:unnamed protein product [Protopolystoma xenopodis]|uniref:Uncharacterized protein n=1 Tax=Protopolystoma xenopodis TaxID=117903 RepID=A0A3S5FBM2_9PLAT|nr:unnamed protein product [Protopolystoma xenopodis]
MTSHTKTFIQCYHCLGFKCLQHATLWPENTCTALQTASTFHPSTPLSRASSPKNYSPPAGLLSAKIARQGTRDFECLRSQNCGSKEDLLVGGRGHHYQGLLTAGNSFDWTSTFAKPNSPIRVLESHDNQSEKALSSLTSINSSQLLPGPKQLFTGATTFTSNKLASPQKEPQIGPGVIQVKTKSTFKNDENTDSHAGVQSTMAAMSAENSRKSAAEDSTKAYTPLRFTQQDPLLIELYPPNGQMTKEQPSSFV